ncbi:rCG62419 [Rattus norvegicus]|uniref:RCG62419 n=1 Tax=Rattus norvegicus TaxID=10116 RepID=A6HBH7_RAT|nr:rCG62419 [Rattus norvegicus]
MRSRLVWATGGGDGGMKKEQQELRERGRKRLLPELSFIHPLNKKNKK